MMKAKGVRLCDRGTTGLLQFLAAGPDRLYGARWGTVRREVYRRGWFRERVWLLNEVANDERARRVGWSVPKLSPLERLEKERAR